MTHEITDLRWHTCTKDAPWNSSIKKRVIHPDATEVEQRNGCTVRMSCPNCGHAWTEEVPQ